MKWFRFYSDALDDPKVQRLPGELFKAWVNLLCLAAKDDGHLPSIADIAFALRLSDEQTEAAMTEFAQRGLLDSGEDGVTPHNWQGRQPISDRDPTATERQQRRRSRIASEAVTDVSRVTTEVVTPPDKIRREKTTQEEKREENTAQARAADAAPVALSERQLLHREMFDALSDAFGQPAPGQEKTRYEAAAKALVAAGAAPGEIAHLHEAWGWINPGVPRVNSLAGQLTVLRNASPPPANGRASPNGRTEPRSFDAIKRDESRRGMAEWNARMDEEEHGTDHLQSRNGTAQRRVQPGAGRAVAGHVLGPGEES